MHSSQFGITFTDSRGPVNSDGPIHCIRSLNRMVRYSVMPVCGQIPIKDYIYNVISDHQKHSVGVVVYIVTMLLSTRCRVQSPDNVSLKSIINIIIIQMIMSSNPYLVSTDS